MTRSSGSSPNLKSVKEVRLIRDRCKGCGFCIWICPKQVLSFSDKLNVRGVFPAMIKDDVACVGCGLCELICPDFAIFLERRRKI
ncbi:4Fe-4S binding protein [Candidatus Bathyarchaeota archaeon]|nr:4Fe-4S binding protein [Candidatus Bathyarchaeota archaeon]